MKLRLLLPLVLLLAATAARAGSAQITEADFGPRWPFTVPSGTLSCTRPEGGAAILTFAANGTTYAVNGAAAERAEAEGWKLVEEIWKANPSFAGSKANLGPVIARGLALCK